MENKFLKIDDEKQWQNLLDKALFKTFFHNPNWERFLEQNFKWLRFEHYLYENQALLSLCRGKIRSQEKLVSHPFCEYGGLLPLVAKINGEKLKRDLLDNFQEGLMKIKIHPQLLNYFNFQELNQSEIATFWIENLHQKTKEELWFSFRKTLKHSIKKAENQNIQIKKCRGQKELKYFYNLYLKSVKKREIPAYPFSFFDYFFHSSDAEIILAKNGEKVIAGSIFLFYDKFIHYFLNASDEKYRDLGANHLILWYQIKNYLGKDYQVFDFGGTRTGSSLEIFKQGWGGKSYAIYELRNFSEENKIRESKLRKIFGLLPPFLIKKLSPSLLKYKF